MNPQWLEGAPTDTGPWEHRRRNRGGAIWLIQVKTCPSWGLFTGIMSLAMGLSVGHLGQRGGHGPLGPPPRSAPELDCNVCTQAKYKLSWEGQIPPPSRGPRVLIGQVLETQVLAQNGVHFWPCFPTQTKMKEIILLMYYYWVTHLMWHQKKVTCSEDKINNQQKIPKIGLVLETDSIVNMCPRFSKSCWLINKGQ